MDLTESGMNALGYTMVGATDLPRALKFFDPIFPIMGLDQCRRDELTVSLGKSDDPTFSGFFTGYPFDGGSARFGNVTMTAFPCPPDVIDKIRELALKNGGVSESPSVRRPKNGAGFYGACARDPDRNKVAFACYDAP